MHVGRRFDLLLERYRHPDGRRWSGYEIDDATGGVVSRSYVTNLRKGRIENPGYDKLRAIAKAMGFPAQLWFEESLGNDDEVRVEPPPERGNLASRLEYLFKVIKNERTGEPYTNKEVARMSLGALTEEEVEGIRTGRIDDPSVSQVTALAEVFGVRPSWFMDRREKPSFLDEETVKALRDETAAAVLREVMRLPERERAIVLGIVRQFEEVGGKST